MVDWNGEYKELVSFLGGKTLRLGADSRMNMFELFDVGKDKGARAVLDAMDKIVRFNRKERAIVYRFMLDSTKSANAALNLKMLIKQLNVDPQNTYADSKLRQLMGNPLFADHTNFDIKSILDGVTSIDLSGLKDDGQRGEVARAVLGILIRAMHRSEMTSSARTLIVLDEGWRLLGDSEEVSTLFREGRKYGFGLAIATQLAKDVNNEAMANAAFIAIFKLQSGEDYDLLTEAGIISGNDIPLLSGLDVGKCMIRLAKKESSEDARKFLMGRIEGVHTEIYNLVCERMDISVSGRKFLEETERLTANIETKSRIIDFANENGRNIDLTALVKLTLRLGMKRPEIVPYLKALGVDDLSIIKSCEAADFAALEFM